MTTIAEGNENLMILAAHLLALPKERWLFERYIDTTRWKGKPDLSCGTAACAMGWTPALFKHLGVGLMSSNRGGIRAAIPTLFRSNVRWSDVANHLFALDGYTFSHLFTPEGWNRSPTTVEVAKRIVDFVAEREQLLAEGRR